MKTVRVLAACCVVACVSVSVLAQDKKPAESPAGQPARQPREGGPPPREGGQRMAAPVLSAEKSKAAWKVQAEGVAASLSLDAAKTTALVKAYDEARGTNLEATDKLRKQIAEKREQGEEGRAAIEELRLQLLDAGKTSRENIEKAFAAILTAEQVTKAMSSLGTFNRQWDVMTDSVLGFSLDSAKAAEATKAIQTYVESMSATRRGEPGQPGGAGGGGGGGMGEARNTLMDSMKKTLTEAQFGKFQAATGMGGRRGGDGPRPPGGGEGEPRRRPGGG